MRDLLERWARLEPKRCKAVEGQRPAWSVGTAYYRDDGSKVGTDQTYIEVPPTGVPRMGEDRGALLVAVIEAIETRGWTFQLLTTTQTLTGDPLRAIAQGYDAHVYASGPRLRHRVLGRGESTGNRYLSAVEALLTAYLDALEAEK